MDMDRSEMLPSLLCSILWGFWVLLLLQYVADKRAISFFYLISFIWLLITVKIFLNI